MTDALAMAIWWPGKPDALRLRWGSADLVSARARLMSQAVRDSSRTVKPVNPVREMMASWKLP
ncbi:hypothetical protein CHELA1G11_21679 [Hyphomicrobiales bacterium]|nr:hypothetical protein CHELA1G11_21679 [Hyphomicrobiales bacterium]CAH1695434.1 hypothetical protein CHELA1G2_21984 [Hyphomicrobiales bacterium]